MRRTSELVCIVGLTAGLSWTVAGAQKAPERGTAKTDTGKAEAKAPRAGAPAGALKPGHRTATGVGKVLETANGDEEARRAAVVASFESGQITVAKLEDQIAERNPLARMQYSGAGERKKLYDKTLELELMGAEAEARGFGNDRDVVYAIKQHAVQTLIQKDFEDGLSRNQIPDAEVAAYYEANIAEFVRPAMRRASHIRLATKKEALALLTEVKSADIRTFRRLARHQSTDETTKLRGGDLRYFGPDGKTPGNDGEGAPPALAKAAFSLKTSGQTYDGVIEVDGGFSLLKLTGLRGKSERTMKQVDETIRMRLWREKQKDAVEALVRQLKADHKPDVKAELIELVKLEDEVAVPRGGALPSAFPTKARPGTGP